MGDDSNCQYDRMGSTERQGPQLHVPACLPCLPLLACPVSQPPAPRAPTCSSSMCADSMPPTARIVNSNTCTRASMSKVTLAASQRTASRSCSRSPITCSRAGAAGAPSAASASCNSSSQLGCQKNTWLAAFCKQPCPAAVGSSADASGQWAMGNGRVAATRRQQGGNKAATRGNTAAAPTHNEHVEAVNQGERDASLRVLATAADGAQVILWEGSLHVLPVAEAEHFQRLLPAGEAEGVAQETQRRQEALGQAMPARRAYVVVQQQQTS